jgi:hypothetical protein
VHRKGEGSALMSATLKEISAKGVYARRRTDGQRFGSIFDSMAIPRRLLR